MEEDKEIKALFDDFKPQLSDNERFLQRLERRMQMADLLKEQMRVQRRQSRIMMAVAFVVGAAACAFVAGHTHWLVLFAIALMICAGFAGVWSLLVELQERTLQQQVTRLQQQWGQE